MTLNVQLAKYDYQKAMIQYSIIQTSILNQFTEYRNQEEQHKVIEELLDEVKRLGLTGIQYSRKKIVKQVINYCVSRSYISENESDIIPLTTLRSSTLVKYNRFNQTDPQVPTIDSSAATISLAMHKNKVIIDQVESSKSVGLHICINPTSALQEGSLKKNRDVQESISNNLTAYFQQRKKERKLGKAGMFRLLELEEQKKYEQITNFFFQKNSIKCLSFDFFFDGKKFSDACKRKNPFDFGSIYYLDLSIDYAYTTNTAFSSLGNFKQPKYNISQKSLIYVNNLKQKNHQIMKWKAYKNLDIFLGLIADSVKVKDFRMISLSGLFLTHSVVVALGRILQNGQVEYLNLAGCSISKKEQNSDRDGLMLLRDTLSMSKDLKCAILDDLTYCQKIKRPTSCFQTEKVFVYQRLTDLDFSCLIFELDYMKYSLNEIYLNWNKDYHTNRTFIIDHNIEIDSDNYEVENAIISDNQGSLGEKSYEMLYSMVFQKNLQVYEAKNNQFPYDKVQNFAIALLSNSRVLQLSLSGNIDYQYLHEAHCCFTCCGGLFGFCNFLSKCFSCFKVQDISRRPIQQEVDSKLLILSNQNRNDVVRKPYYKQEKKKYYAYKAELDVKEEQERKVRELLEQARLKRIEDEMRAKREAEEKEHQKKLELAREGAAKTLTNVQVHHEGSIANFGDTNQKENSKKALESIPFKIKQKKSKQDEDKNKISDEDEDDDDDEGHDTEQLKTKASKGQKRKSSPTSQEEKDDDDDYNNKKPKEENANKQPQQQGSGIKNQSEDIKNQAPNQLQKQNQPETKLINTNQEKSINDLERAKLVNENNIIIQKKDDVVDQVISLE
ncbi:hypothetical protein ABPG74_020781 [Tetrahymena malaccensis]